MDKHIHVVSLTQRQAGRNIVRKENIIGPELDKITCAPSKDSDQPGRLTNLIIAFAAAGSPGTNEALSSD